MQPAGSPAARSPEAQSADTRSTLLAAVSSPLVFFALALLIVEASLTIVVAGSGLPQDQRFAGLVISAVLFLVVVGLTTLLAVRYPRNLVFREASYLESDRLEAARLLKQVVEQRTMRPQKEQPPEASKARVATVDKAASPGERSQVLRRAERLSTILRGGRILWIDDEPEGNVLEAKLLESLGVTVDFAQTSKAARSMLRLRSYDAMISDIWRGDVSDEGLRFLRELHEDSDGTSKVPEWTIFYTADFDPALGTPAYALGITNRPDHLLHYVMDAMERARG